MHRLLIVFLSLKIFKEILETFLEVLNKSYYEDKKNQDQACAILKIEQGDFLKSLYYARDKFIFGQISGWIGEIAFILFLVYGGFGWIEGLAIKNAHAFGFNSIGVGLLFFVYMGAFSFLLSLPFKYYSTFVLEEKHGFNRQTVKGFIADQVKGILLGSILGGIILALILWIMDSMGDQWWLWAWVTMTGFSLFTAWLYPTLIAPLFNKFKPVEEGSLKNAIYALAEKINFKTSGIFIMDASTRSSHGNAYFTGLFSKKQIVLFDTLLKDLSENQIVAVLAHELGHFKLNHVRWGLLRGIILTGVMFFLLNLCLPMQEFYEAFALKGTSHYGALLVFSSWFGLVDFFLTPIGSLLSRQNEFAADSFAKETLGTGKDLAEALMNLRESNKSMPITHPLYSTIYYSHPPIIERIKAL